MKTNQPVEKMLCTGSVKYVNPPVKGVDIKREKFTIDPEKGARLKSISGTEIIIPKNAIVDAQGNPVNGDVDILYREFKDVGDIFISGIPMKYDSSGTGYHFESAGMLELLAYKDGKPVFLKPDKPIDIKMRSNNGDDKFNLYYLDTNKRNWVYKGKDKIEKNDIANAVKTENVEMPKSAELKNDIADIQKEIIKLKDEEPVKPEKADKGRYHFTIDFSEQEFPELAVYKGVTFEVGEENKNYSEKDAETVWENVDIAKGGKKGSYNIKFSDRKHSVEYITYPVFKNEDYQNAMNIYEKKYAEYASKLKQRKEEEKIKQEEYKKRMEEEIALQKRIRKEYVENLKKMELAASTSDMVFRVFQVSGFGVWNCDMPQKLPQGQTLMARFVDKNGKGLVIECAYLVERDRNALFTYYYGNFSNLRFNPSKNNMIWGITKDNKLAVFYEDDFKNIPKSSRQYDFKMTIIDRELKTADDVKKELNVPFL